MSIDGTKQHHCALYLERHSEQSPKLVVAASEQRRLGREVKAGCQRVLRDKGVSVCFGRNAEVTAVFSCYVCVTTHTKT